jgi:hypothetical protein
MMPVRLAGLWVLCLLALAWPVHATENAVGPVLSHVAGFYDKPFFLRLSHPDPGVTIYYTLDGSEPHPASLDGVPLRYKNTYSYRRGDPFGELLETHFRSHRYDHPLVVADRSPLPDRYTRISTSLDFQQPNYFPELGELSRGQRRRNALIDPFNAMVHWTNRTLASWGLTWLGPVPALKRHEVPGSNRMLKATALRAAAYRDGERVGPVVSATYFVMPRETFSLPVVSLLAQEDRLFGYEDGILVAGKAHDDFRRENPDQQRAQGAAPANWRLRGVEVPTHLQYFSHRIHPTRASLDQGVGIRIHGGATRAAPIKSLRLYARKEYGATRLDHPFFGEPKKYKRLLLRNSGNDANGALFRDAIMHKASATLRFDVQDYQPTVVFLNGEYWGILNLREYLNADYLERVHGVKEKELDLMDIDEADEGDDRHWRALLAYLERHSMRDPAHFAHVETQVDIDNFIDYQAANLYAGNSDWPHNNQRFWRKRITAPDAEGRPAHDGRWRWFMFDVDMGMTRPEVSRLKPVTSIHKGMHLERNNPKALFIHLLESPVFRERFLTRFADLLNTSFESQRMRGIITGMRTGIEPEIDRHIQRWKTPESRETWESVIEHFLMFAEHRPALERQKFVRHFGLPGTYALQIDRAGDPRAHVRVNTIDIAPGTDGVGDTPYPWRGEYFQGVPLQLQAEPAACFSHWDGVASTEALLRLLPTTELRLKAVFRDSCPDS